MAAPSSTYDTPLPDDLSPASPSPKLNREEEAKQKLEHTQISPFVSWMLIGAFLATILFVPTVQFITKARGHEPVLPSLGRTGVVPQAEELKAFENDLEEQSVVAGWALPPIQGVLTRMGVGNEKAVIGRDGWLAFRPDLDYLSSRGFLESAASPAAKTGARSDPVAAIVNFKDQLARRGITLVLLPTPLKPMIEPGPFCARRASLAAPLQNPSFPAFLRQMQEHGVLLYDPTPALFEAERRTGQAQFLHTDTHWTPHAMQTTARGLAAFIEGNVGLQPFSTTYTRRLVEQTGEGDIARMLKLPPRQTTFPAETVQLEQVQDGDKVWRPAPDADVMLLGDSFSNIYSRAAMGWGEGAGLAEQLSFNLGRPLDVIAINAGGSYSTRRRLHDELLRGDDRLAGKRLVVWQFAMRDLQSGNWQLLDLLPASGAGQNTQVSLRSPPSGFKPLPNSPEQPSKPAVVARFRAALAGRARVVEGKRVVRGADGWLFYLPDVLSLSDAPFLGSGRNPQIEALVDFERQLAQRGIKLLVVPLPAKSTIYPEKLGLGIDSVPQAPQNPSLSRFAHELQTHGIRVFDPTSTLLFQKRASRAPVFMPTDSHWTFVGMEATAAQLAAHMEPSLPARTPIVYTRRAMEVRNVTDLSLMIPRQENNTQVVRLRQTLQQVLTPDGQLWQPSRDADILVMGDSFVNIYSYGGYWGKSAGLAEQLSYYLQRPVDVLGMDGGGVNNTRRALQLDMLRGNDRLKGKKLVIYEVAAHYLMKRDWKKFALPVVGDKQSLSPTPPPPIVDPLTDQWVSGTVAARSSVPNANSTPYPDMVMTLRLADVRVGAQRVGDIVVYTWGLRGAARTAAANWKEGQIVRLRLSPWGAKEQEFGSYNRTDLEGDAEAQLKAYWTLGAD